MALAAAIAVGGTLSATGTDDAFLSWSRRDATAIVAGMRRTDNVGNRMSFRGLKTDRAINYRLRATWLTPDVIRATARALQIDERLSNEDASTLVNEAESAADTVFFIELDPREGSGVIPLEWTALLQPRGLQPRADGSVRGTLLPKLRDVRALSGLFKRDYAYDAFWMAFTLTPAQRAALFSPNVQEIDLVVNIQGREGVVAWSVPSSIRNRFAPH